MLQPLVKGLPTLSASKSTEPKKLTGLHRNELDWIVMKALKKDRSRATNRRPQIQILFKIRLTRPTTLCARLYHPKATSGLDSCRLIHWRDDKIGRVL